ncbi:hypothetical protein GCM10012285_61690 [Streptomyces kronopolitis]|uniref:DUF4439 domain-containing protein n=1 Tax=Streptomyces kronopolitis TaxID=1612435 RepID=A0ABQ2K023_9ACTN|nr:hypothetical protein [Streptomyces kronopolitis]GGN62001.1 hypothetical protein GCM10012285_61690 [Streptomyces kronopolitis]
MPPDHLDLPARRRRHARLIAALTGLIGACAEAADLVYWPIATAPPGQEAVAVDVMPLKKVALTAAIALDHARDADKDRWPTAVAREQEDAARTYAARCVVARAQDLLEEPGPLDMPPLTAEHAAEADLISAGATVATRWRRDPEQAVALVRELAADGELSVNEILDAAVDSTVLTGLVALHDAVDTPDPSTAAEKCVEATPYLALAVTLASVDLD